MREKLGWATASPRIASAQARLAGDEELLSIIELLQKASMMGVDGLKGAIAGGGLGGSLTVSTAGLGGVDRGPLTGPAHLANENVFEKSFWAGKRENEVQSPNSISSPDTITEEPEEEVLSARTLSPVPNDLEATASSSEHQKAANSTDLANMSKSPTNTTPPADDFTPRPQRSSLKRTYTDVGGYSLQQKLTEALAQPYLATNSPQSAIATSNAPTFRPPPPPRSGTTVTERAPHGTRNNQAQAQAIFTTEAQCPWTITAANDLACLVFGVTRAEVRKLGIMEVIAESRRDWLKEKLKNPESGTTPRQGGQHLPLAPTPNASPATPDSASSSPKPPGLASAMGKGITAKLLSKPPSRHSYLNRRSKTEGGNAAPAGGPTVNSGARTTSVATPHSNSPAPSSSAIASPPSAHIANKSRGVLLCGDVVPIRKMDGTTGSASLWVKEKSGGLIWVLEEIAEDVAYLTVDEIGSVIRGKGDIEAIWGLERVRNGMDVQRLIPSIPKLKGTNTGALDYDEIARLKRFTARTANSISIPVTVEQIPQESTFRVSSFPHIAGILVLEPSTLRISSSNSVFSSALFGYANPDGLPITDLIPGFDATLRVMTDEDSIELIDGIVIPEHSFRRARALLALREGSADAAAVFLRPAGLEAKHRDGAEIMVDVQMRVVKSSDREPAWTEAIIEEEDGKSVAGGSDVVYALWITYSRQLHAVNHGIGPVTSRLSRPSTPPSQPTPESGRGHVDSSVPSPMAATSTLEEEELRTRLLTQQLEGAKAAQDTRHGQRRRNRDQEEEN
jgi:protein-serine/threonine kinase